MNKENSPLKNKFDYPSIQTDDTIIAHSPNETDWETSFKEELMTYFPELSNSFVQDSGNYDLSIDENARAQTPLLFFSADDTNNKSSSLRKDKLNLLYISKYKNRISPDKIILGEEKNTCVLIKNIPKKYSPKSLASELKSINELNGSFNFFYLPFDETKRENFGFAFINFVNPLNILLFYEKYQKKTFKKYITDRNIELFYVDDMQLPKVESKQNILIPLKYKDFFKKVYHNAVCVTKDINIFNEGVFQVKTLGKVLH